jgi:hypothetical protein
VAAVIFFQSFYSLFMVLPTAALAGTPGAIKINEFSSYGNSDWVELYNTTGASVDVAGWYVQNGSGVQQTLAGSIAAHDFLLVQKANFLSDTQDVIRLFDDTPAMIDVTSYGSLSSAPVPSEGKSSALVTDGGAVWALASPTPGYTNVIDTIPPTVPTGGTPNDAVMTTHAFSFEWNAASDVGGDVTYELRARASAAPDESTPVLSIDDPSAPFLSVSGYSDGDWYWQVRAVDAVQNRGGWSDVWHVTVDAAGPSIAINSPTGGAIFGGPDAKQIAVNASLADPSGVSSYYVELDGSDITSLMSADTPVGAASITLNTVLESSALADGDHTLRVVASDGHGVANESSVPFTVDVTNPTVTTNLRQNQVLEGIVSVEGTANDPRLSSFIIRILNADGDYLMLEDSKGDRTEWAASDVTATTTNLGFDWDTSLVADGTYRIQLSAKDSAGNETQLIRTVIVDNVPDPGLGSVIGNDPLLDQLSKQLAQPFLLTTALAPPAYLPQNTIKEATDTSANNLKVSVPETDRNAEVAAIVPSEEGWRLFGVAWYWWLLLILAASFVLYKWRKVYLETRTPRFEEA